MAGSTYDETHIVSDSEGEGMSQQSIIPNNFIYNEVEWPEQQAELAETEEWSGTYHRCFPAEWADSHAPETGPEQCLNCASSGCYQGQFIGYCANCADYVYHGRRGRGFVAECTELLSAKTSKWASAYETYLSGVDFAQFLDARSQRISEAILPDPDDDIIPYGEGSVFDAHFEGGYADF